MEMSERPIAITDVETTGLNPEMHEIVEIGLIVVDQKTLAILDELDIKVRPEHLEIAEARALQINGYKEADWKDAVSLQEAMSRYADKTAGAMFAAHNVTFDWSFILRAFKRTGVQNLMDYHCIDLFTAAYIRLRDAGLEKFNLNEVAKHLGIGEEPMPHRAINGTRTVYEIFKRLVGV